MTIISIEGNIGADKECVINVLRKYLNEDVIFIDDSIYNWKDTVLLSNFYKIPERWAFCVQIQSITQKYKRFIEILPHKKSDFLMFTHRSPMSDKYCFEKSCRELKYLNDKENEIYNSVFETQRIPKFHGVIYLKSDVNRCYENIISKNDKIEKNINFDFIRQIDKNYELWITKLKEENIPILEIDVENFRDMEGNEMMEEKLIKLISDKFSVVKNYSRKFYCGSKLN